MIRSVISSSLRFRFLVLIVAAALILFGIVQIRTMPVDVYPEFGPPVVEVQTEALGLSAAEVESLITVPMEADLLNGAAWMDQIYSESVAGLSRVLMIFEAGTDPILARQMVQERLTQAHALPNVSKPPVMLQPVSSSSRVMMVGLSSKTLSLIEMGVLARWNIKPRLMGISGVANVSVWGQRERQLQVQVDPKQLREKNVTLQQIIETTGEALWVSPLSFLESSSPGTAGWIDTPNQRLGIRHLLPINSAQELAKVAVEGKPELLLGDVAKVVEDHQPLIGDAVLNEGPGLILVIEKFPSANSLDVTKNVEAALEAMKPGLTGMDIDAGLFRPASYIERATGNLSTAAMIAAALIAIVLLAFFFGWRTALISFIVIPASLMAAGFVLYLRGATLNAVVLAGLVMALGIVIDGAIVDVESMARRLRENRASGSSKSAAAVIVEAAHEMRSPLFAALLMMLLVALPIFFIQGISGSFFRPLVVTYVIAILVAFVVALSVTPALSLVLVSSDGTLGRNPSPLVTALQSFYSSVCAPLIRKPGLAYAVAGVSIVIGLALLPMLPMTLLPALKQTDLLIQWKGAPGTSRQAMNRTLAQVGNELRTIPGVRNVGSHVGRAETGDQIVSVNSADLWVNLDSKADYDATVAAINEVISGYPGLFSSVQNYQPAYIGQALNGIGNNVTVRVYGNDWKVLHEKAEEVQKIAAGVSGIASAQAILPIEEPQVEIEVNLTAAEKLGVKPGDVRRGATVLLSGLQVGSLFEDQKVFDVVVWGVPEIRSSLSNIQDLLIDTPEGQQIRLGDVAEVRIVPSPNTIQRDAVSRYIDVVAQVNGRDASAVTANLKASLAGVTFPIEHHLEVLDDAANQQTDQQRVFVIVAAVLIGIFLLLQALFGSWRVAGVTLLTLPMALGGGVVLALLSGGLSLGALFGLLAVLGMAVHSSVVTISHLQQLEHDEGEPFGHEMVLRGMRERIGPIVMSALATAVAVLPVVFAGNIAGTEIIRPMALVMLGGLVTSLLLNLLVLPALYLRFGYTTQAALAPTTKLAVS